MEPKKIIKSICIWTWNDFESNGVGFDTLLDSYAFELSV
jgi:hypothetical protein